MGSIICRELTQSKVPFVVVEGDREIIASMDASADSVVFPYFIGGLRIAHTLIKPAVVDFIEFATRGENIELQMEEVKIEADSKIINQSLAETEIGKDFGIIIVAIKRESEEMEFNPKSTSIIHKGDTLIAMGKTKQLVKLEEFVGA